MIDTSRILAFAFSCLLCGPALAQSEVVDGTILPGWRTVDGSQMAAVQFRLAPGWKTYWRAPGDNGIPPAFNWSGSDNIKSVRIHWPRPDVFHLNGVETIGYAHELVLPIEVIPRDPSRPIQLQAHVDLGVCRDICVPASLQLSGDLMVPGAPDTKIRSALDQRPDTSAEAGLKSIVCTLDPTSDGLRVTAVMNLPDTGGQETVIFESGQPGVWVSPSATARQGRTLTATADLVAPSGAPFALPRGGITVTVLGQQRAVEIKGCPSG